jgi:hypothetical protein
MMHAILLDKGDLLLRQSGFVFAANCFLGDLDLRRISRSPSGKGGRAEGASQFR